MITQDATRESAVLVEQGVAAMKAGNKEGAIAAFRLAAELTPNNDAAWLWLASLYTDIELVAHCLQRVVAINPANEQAARALQAVTQKMQAAATLPAKPAITTDVPATPSSAPAPAQPPASSPQQNAQALDFEELKRRGIVAAKGGRHAEAKDYLVAAVGQNESDVESWYWLSTVVDNPEDKQIALENVITLDPSHTTAASAIEANAPALQQYLLEKQKNSGVLNAAQPHADSVPGALDDQNRQSSKLTTPGGQGAKRMNPSESVLPVGQVIEDKYTVLRQIKGSSDIVTWDAQKRRFYILRPMYGDASDLASASSKARVAHNDVSYVIMPIETKGISLSSFVRTVGALPPSLVTQYGLAMLKKLEAEQSSNLSASAQKSLRPDTITFDAQCNVVLEPPSENYLTMSLGSDAVPYIPPEQLEKGLVTATSDIYSIGAILYFMLTGSPPPMPERLHVQQAPGPVSINFANSQDIPSDLAQVIAIALQPNPLERYPSALVMYQALAALDTKGQTSKGLAIPRVAVVAAVLVVVALALFLVAGVLKGFRFPGSLGNDAQASSVTPTSVPVAAAAPTSAPPPLDKLIINAVDSRRFPANTVYLSALDPSGLPFAGLTAGSLKLRENGADVASIQLTGLQNTMDAVSVIVALDTSAKMSGKTMDDAKTAIHLLADLMQPGDHMALMTFGGSAQMVVPYTVSKAAFLSGADQQEAGDKRDIEGVFGLASSLAKDQPQGGYTALIIITNGGLPTKQPDLSALASPANSANLPVFFLGTDPATFPTQSAQTLANLTGGIAISPAKADTGEIGEAMKKIEKQLHNVYKLTYDSQASGYGTDHNLELSVTLGAEPKTDKRSYQVPAK